MYVNVKDTNYLEKYMRSFGFVKKALCTALLCFALASPVLAENTVIVDDFASADGNVVWTAGERVSKLDNTKGYLRVLGEESESSEIKVVRGDFASPILMDDAKEISVKVLADSNGEADGYYVRIMLFGASGEILEGISQIPADEFVEVKLDVSEWKHKEIVEGIEIGLIPEHTDSGTWTGSFSIDDLVAVSFAESELAKRFLFDEATVTGGKIVFAEDGSYFNLVPDEDAENTTIEFDVNVSAVAFADTLRLNIENYSESDKMMIAFSDSEAFSKEIYTALEPTEERRVYYVETGIGSSVKKVRLKVFGKGVIRFNGISLTDAYSSRTYITYGDITSARLSADEKQIIITGEIPREFVTEFEGCELYLYALDLNEDPKEADYDNLPVLATHGISTKFTFRLDVGKQSGDSIFKKYVVKISSTPKVFVDTPTYVSAGDTTSAKKEITIGYSSSDLSGTAESLSEIGVVDISINKLLSSVSSGYMQASAGRYNYFDKSYVDLLDSKIAALYSSGVAVTARLVVDGKELDGLYFDSSADSDAYLINVGDERGYGLVRAAIEFLVTRYSDARKGVIDAFIIGEKVNVGRDVSGAPNMSVTDLVNSYANAMRLVYISAANCGANVRVYASVGDIYRSNYVVLRNNETDTELFVKALGEYIGDEGYFPWGVCVESVEGMSGERITASEKRIFSSFLSDMSAYSGASVMKTSLMRDGTAAIEEFIQAAELGFVGKYVFSDVSGTNAKLIRALNTGDERLIETVGADAKAYASLVSTGKIKTRKYSLGEALLAKPEKLIGSYVYYDFNTHTGIGGFTTSYYAESVRVAEDRAETPVLLAKIDKSLYGENDSAELSGVGVVFDTPKSFSLTPVLSFDVALSGADNTELASSDIVIRLTSKTKVYEYIANVGMGEFNTVYIDLGRQASETFESVQVLVKDNAAKSFELSVDNITGYSREYNDSGLNQAINMSGTSSENSGEGRDIIAVVITVFAILLTVVASIVIIKSADKKKDNKDN